MARVRWIVMLLGAALLAPAAATGHGDHPAPAFTPQQAPGTTVNSGGAKAQWQRIATFATGNPHTDLDFFTQRGEIFVAVGTLAVGPNAGGQTILRLTDGSQIRPSHVAAHPSASCVSDPAAALGLQHDVEATPKGGAILNSRNPVAVRTDTQLILDASDAEGRCHDSLLGGIDPNSPQGGLEIVDVTTINRPVEIGLTSHIGEAHTVNVDPKRPHIAYAVTSDAITVTNGQRQNEVPASSDRFDLDGFEVVDLRSCMNFAPTTSVEVRRMMCRPQVYRYRYPTTSMSIGHTMKSGANAIFGCHELEVYANDRLACGSGNAAMLFDLSGAFDDNGTPADYTDDRPRGQPLPCRTRVTTSPPPYATGAPVIDCVVGQGSQALDVPSWIALGSPSLEGVQWLGSAYHQGRGGPHNSKEDIDFDHELELTDSGRFLLATDERGGGVTPPGASCVTSPGDHPEGNGGVHAYAVDRLQQASPSTAAEAWQAYARTPAGGKAIYRTAIRTQPQSTLCTAHVFQQIPGQNRIFMGWYTQGTQVVDFIEHASGSFEFRETGWFIPENANTWVSHIFGIEENADCTFTYYGATGDFHLGAAGRSAVDIYKVTLPAPVGAACTLPGGTQPPPTPSREPVNRLVRGSGKLAPRKGRTLSARARRTRAPARFTVNVSKGRFGGVRGRLRYNDRRARVRVDTRRFASVTVRGKTAVLVGTGRSKGRRTRFVLRIVDRGRGRRDAVRMTMRGYRRAAPLALGNVVVR
jgi:hypothetical protein